MLLQLTPLPRLSLEFQHRASSHRDSSRASLDDCSLYSPSNSGHGLHSSSSSWQPSMTRIRSGHDLQLLGDNAANAVQMQQQQHMPWPAGLSLQDAPTAGEATESLGHSPLAEGLEQIREVGIFQSPTAAAAVRLVPDRCGTQQCCSNTCTALECAW